MEDILERFQGEDVSWAPETIGDYRRVVDNELRDTQCLWFHYENDNGWRWQVLYDKEVEDYTVHIYLPLATFTDIGFISATFEEFLPNLKGRLVPSLTASLIDPSASFAYNYKRKQLDIWDYETSLPPEIAGFRRDITPDKGIRFINGSYIVASYDDKGEPSGLLLYYNVFRDEFFAELRRHNIPEIVHELDATTIKGLEQVLKEHLGTVLGDLRNRL